MTNMQNIKLNYPIESDGANITDLNMRRSKVKDRLIVAKMKNSSDEEKEIRLFANLCEVTQNCTHLLDHYLFKSHRLFSLNSV